MLRVFYSMFSTGSAWSNHPDKESSCLQKYTVLKDENLTFWYLKLVWNRCIQEWTNLWCSKQASHCSMPSFKKFNSFVILSLRSYTIEFASGNSKYASLFQNWIFCILFYFIFYFTSVSKIILFRILYTFFRIPMWTIQTSE